MSNLDTKFPIGCRVDFTALGRTRWTESRRFDQPLSFPALGGEVTEVHPPFIRVKGVLGVDSTVTSFPFLEEEIRVIE